MNREEVKRFWSERAKVTETPRSESKVNFESDAKMADMRVEAEASLLNSELRLKSDDVLVDLGAGNGRFSLLFAPKVHKVTAVEYIKDFSDDIKEQAKMRGIENIEVINSPAEDFCRDNYASVVFISGLLIYLDHEQYYKTISNVSKTLKQGGRLFVREPVSVLREEFIVDKFSEELGTHYCSLYRTCGQHIEAFEKYQFRFEKSAPFFEDGSVLNKRLETRLYYFCFVKE
jgi:precorrin-6B methylase 2